MARDLLLDIAHAAAPVCISDLKSMRPQMVAAGVASVEADDYQVEDWYEAYRYLIGEEAPVGLDAFMVRDLLLNKLPFCGGA